MRQTPDTDVDRHPVAAVCEEFGQLLDGVGEPALWSASDADVAAIVRAAEGVTRRAAAVQARAVAEAQRRELADRAAATSTTAWLSGLVGATPRRARALTRLAEDLTAGAEQTGAALGRGAIEVEQAQVIAGAVRRLPDEVGDELRGKAETYLLEQAEWHHAGRLAKLAAHLLDVIAPELAEQRLGAALAAEQRRDAERGNWFGATVSYRGRIRLSGELDSESWSLVAAALEPFTKPAAGQDTDGTAVRDQRSGGQRRAEALVELCRRTLAAEVLPTAGGWPAHVAVTIDYDRLRTATGVGMLATGAPLTAADVRRIACDAKILPIVLGGGGVPLDVGRLQRTFSKELRRAVEVRDSGCAFPGCAREAAWCQVHHIVHWVDGGDTCLDNGVLLCGHHHRVLHRGEWTVRIGRHRRPEFIPPAYLDRDRRPRTNTTHLRT